MTVTYSSVLFLALIAALIAVAAQNTDLQIWCASLEKNGTYINQRCITFSPSSQDYVVNLASGCTAMSHGRMAMLTSPKIINQVTVNLTKQFGATRFQVSLRQKYASNNGIADNWFWTDVNNVTYGLNNDLQWNSGEPNDWPGVGVEDGQEDCSDFGGTNAKIYDSACTNTARQALCEYREPLMYYTPYFVGQSVISSSSALISGQSDFKVIQLEHCAILCHLFGSCEAFVFKKNTITCTLLFRIDMSSAERISEADATIYGFD